jgi:hypothetical protein
MPGEMTAGEHTLAIELKGATDRVAKPEIGIDFIWVQNR